MGNLSLEEASLCLLVGVGFPEWAFACKTCRQIGQYYLWSSWEYDRLSFTAIVTISSFATIIYLWVDLMSWILILVAVFGWRSAGEWPAASGTENASLLPRAN